MKLHNHYCTFWDVSREAVSAVADQHEKSGAVRVGQVYEQVKDGVALFAQHMVSAKPFGPSHKFIEYPRG